MIQQKTLHFFGGQGGGHGVLGQHLADLGLGGLLQGGQTAVLGVDLLRVDDDLLGLGNGAGSQHHPDPALGLVTVALAQGLGSKIKAALERAIALAPAHADAHIALGAFHAEVIDKVGALIGGMTYGAKKDTGLKLFQQALQLNPGSAIAMIEYANALVMLEGDKKMKEATKLYEQAAACEAADAMEHLDVALARAELADD